jgi:hypothetical protein
VTVTTKSQTGRSNRRWSLLLFIGLVIVYSTSAVWSFEDQNVDTIAATLPAWHLLNEGDIDLGQFEGVNPWIVDTPDGAWTNRPPGLIAVALVAHAVALPLTSDFTGVPGTVMAVLLAAAAVTTLAREIARMYGMSTGLVSAVALGLGSATWPQASAELFPHAVGQFLMAVIVWAMARERHWLAGWTLAAAILVRPPLAVVALVLGLSMGWKRKSLQPVISIGVPSALGLATLVAYNRLVFGTLSISGGYGDFVGNGSEYRTVSGYLSNLFGTFFDGSNGLFAWSPWLLVAILFMVVKRPRPESDWVMPAALAGLAYLLVHTGLNRFWGGLAFNYRYALEPLTLAMPMLALGLATIRDQRSWRLAFTTALGVSIVLQAAVAYLLTCVDSGGVAECRLL